MKKLVLVTAALGLIVSSNVFAAGSKIKNSTITNKSTVKNSNNMAIGGFIGDANANQGSIAIKGSKVKNSTITNKSTVKNSNNMAIGGFIGDATANQGSIDIK